MKSINFSLIISVIGIAMLASNCSVSAETPINIANLIELRYQTGPEIRINQDLEVWIVNQSKYCISFPVDFGLKVFAETKAGWSEVPNLGHFIGNEPILLIPNGNVFSENIVDIRPDVSGLMLTKPMNFFATISGHLCDDESAMVEKRIDFVVAP